MRTFLIIAVLSFLYSCKKDNAFDCFKGHGSETVETRILEPFDQIAVADNFDVHIIQSAEFKVEVIGGKNMIGNIETSVKDGTLSLFNHNKCNFVRGYKRAVSLRVYLPHILYLSNDNVGIVTVDEKWQQDSISVKVASSGDIHLNGTYRVMKSSSSSNGDMYLSGKTQKLFVYTTGLNYVKAEGLTVSDYMFIHTVTLGDCFVNADGTQQFDYNIQKSGNIYYTGTPVNIGNFSDQNSSGKLIKKE